MAKAYTYRVKDVNTSRVYGGEFTSKVDPDDPDATAELLDRQVKRLNIHHPDGFQLQVWHQRKGWVDLDTTTG